MSAPTSYVTNPDAVSKTLSSLTVGDVTELGKSYGGRSIVAVRYGEFEPIDRRANLSSAHSARDPEAFFGSRKKRVLVISSAVHGAEIESIAGVMNLISVLESGQDLKGNKWPTISEGAAGLRIVIVPITNPDGRVRIPSDDQLEWSNDQMETYRHGADVDGKPVEWIPGCFSPHPQRFEERSVMGGYFNDAGVNPSHGAFFDRDISPEAHLLSDLAYDETADCFLDLHSCGSGPFFITGMGALSTEFIGRQTNIDGAWRVRMRQRQLPAPNWVNKLSGRKAMGLAGVIHHRSGSLPLCFEGGSGSRYSGGNIHQQIIDTYLTLFETLIEIGVTEGYKPPQ